MKPLPILLSLSLSVWWLTPIASAASDAQQILRETGVKGGLVIHVNCGDGQLTAGLCAGDAYLVHGLDADVKNIGAARRHIQSLGLYGKVSVEQWNSDRLPYADNLVNLIVTSGEGWVARDEMLRVLAPNGVALDTRDPSRVTLRKPWPKEIDEWTHHLHDAGGNAVARDSVVGPPQHLQWTDGPLWSRSHGWTPSVSAMVSAGGRVFYICDETLTGVDGTVPDKWMLVARDAFNGVLLWKRSVPHWGSKELSGTPGTGAGSTTGRFTMPANLGKRLVAVGDTVYVTLGADAPVTALDAATGQDRCVYAETARADELLVSNGRLIVTLNPSAKPDAVLPDRTTPPPPAPGKQVCAVDTKTGKLLWQRGPFNGIRAARTQDPFGRLELAADVERVFVLTDEAIETIALDTGKTVWRLARPALPASADRRLGFAGMYEFQLTVMVVHDGVVLLGQPEPNSPHSYHTMPGSLYAFDARDGRQMWKHAYGAWGHCTQPDVFVVDGQVWTHVDADGKFNIAENGWLKVPDTSNIDYRIQALDLRTGAVRKELPTKDLFNVGHHHRCYRNKITERFLTTSRRGVEFVDLVSGENYQNHWVRSGCLLGNLPCNGLLYVAPHPCGCYLEAKLTGFNALAPARPSSVAREGSNAERLERGPAYTQPSTLNPQPSTSEDWPTYRHDGQRSGATEGRVGTTLGVRWTTRVGQRLSSPVIVAGKVFVADVDGHGIQALASGDGKPLWRFTAGGRVDSPPTIHQGLALFGSADGRTYALRAADGALAWRFRAAPEEQRVCAFGQLESAWPVPGSVLVQDGKCWFAAGRSSYLDGGIHFYALDPATGKVGHNKTIYDPDPATGKMANETSANVMPGLLNDIPATDGASVFIRQMDVSSPDAPAGRHLFTSAGYLDPTWFNRTSWKYGPAETSGLMVLGKDAVFGMELYGSRSANTIFKPGVSAYQLVCRSLKQPAGEPGAKPATRAKKKRGESEAVWEQRLPIRVTAMVRAADTIFVAGSPDIVDPDDPHGSWEGRKGGVLAAFAAHDGKKLAELKLPSPPVWDGMAATEGCLYVSMMDGQVLCLAGKP